MNFDQISGSSLYSFRCLVNAQSNGFFPYWWSLVLYTKRLVFDQDKVFSYISKEYYNLLKRLFKLIEFVVMQVFQLLASIQTQTIRDKKSSMKITIYLLLYIRISRIFLFLHT